MNRHEHFSDEILNAFIDGELGNAEREQLLEAVSRDAGLGHRICELQKVREMVQLAYDMVPGQESFVVAAERRQRRFGRALAASVLLGLGVALGWAGSTQWQPVSAGHGLLAMADAVQKQEAGLAEDEEWRVMVHVSTADPERLSRALAETEKLLESTRREHARVRVEVLTNAGGLDLLRTDTSPNPQLIASLQQRFDNVSFLACRQALDRLQQERGIAAELLPGTRVVPSAVSQIIERQADGWTYIRI